MTEFDTVINDVNYQFSTRDIIIFKTKDTKKKFITDL